MGIINKIFIKVKNYIKKLIFSKNTDSNAYSESNDYSTDNRRNDNGYQNLNKVTTPTDFDRFLREEFGAKYTIKRNISPSVLGGQYVDCRAFDYGFYSGDTLKAVVMYTPHNRDHSRAYRGAKAAAENNGIPFITFFQHMPNERAYVINRIKQNV